MMNSSHKRWMLLAFTSMFGMMNAFCQVDTEFWFAAPYMSRHCFVDKTINAEIRLVLFTDDHSKVSPRVTVTMPARIGFETRSIALSVGAYNTIVLADDSTDAVDEIFARWGKDNRGLLIKSDVQISCYYQVTGPDGEAFTLKGRNALGTDFIVAMQTDQPNAPEYNDAFSSVQIVAIEDNTVVTITPTKSITPAATTVTLNRGETYAFHASGQGANDHIAGTQIHASKPIAVTSNDDSVVGIKSGTYGYDDIGDQLIPIDLLGDEYIAISQKGLNDYCYAIGAYDNTRVTYNNNTYIINKGGTIPINLSSVGAMYIKGDKPFALFQKTSLFESEVGGTILPQLRCTGSSSASYKPVQNNSKSEINILTKTTNVEAFSGSGIPKTAFMAVPNHTEWSYAKKSISSPEKFTITCANGGLFQMGVVDFYSGPNSCTYGYFSDYKEGAHMDIQCEGYAQAKGDMYLVDVHGSFKLTGLADNKVTNYTWTLPNGQQRSGKALTVTINSPQDTGYYTLSGEYFDCDIVPKTVRVVACFRDDSTWLPVKLCSDGLPYTHPSTGLVFSAGSRGKVSQSKTYTNQMGCDSVVTVQLTVLEPTDSIEEAFSCKGTPYFWHNRPYTQTTFVRETLTNAVGCDSICTLKLQVECCPDTIHLYDTITMCDTLMPYSWRTWRDKMLTLPGIYHDTLRTPWGCDSVFYTILLNNYHCCPPIQATVEVPNVCADGKTMEIALTVQRGEIDHYEVHVTNPALNQLPFQDTVGQVTVAVGAPTYLPVTIPSDPTSPTRYPRPDDSYKLDLLVRDVCGHTRQWTDIPFTVYYPSWLIEQHWNDVLGVMAAPYNGGYEFTHIQWLRNGEEMKNEVSPNLYLTHDFWTDSLHQEQAVQFQVQLTRKDDGKTFVTCPLEPRKLTDVAPKENGYVDIFPLVVPREQPIVHVTTNTSGTYWVYAYTGQLIQSADYEPCEHDVLDIELVGNENIYILLFAPRTQTPVFKNKYRVAKIVIE